jgi:hypothetical protein
MCTPSECVVMLYSHKWVLYCQLYRFLVIKANKKLKWHVCVGCINVMRVQINHYTYNLIN